MNLLTFKHGLCGDWQILSALLAAAIHDLRHPGTTNAYHVAQCNPLAMRFNDQHVLENHSLVLALGLLRRPGFDFLENMNEFQQRKVRVQLWCGISSPSSATTILQRVLKFVKNQLSAVQ